MEITRHDDGTVTVLSLSGRLTVSDAPGRLKLAAADALTAGARTIILDLSEVPYIDSTRLGDLISAHITVSRHQGRLVLVCPAMRITALLTLAGLDGVFETFRSVADARTAVGA